MYKLLYSILICGLFLNEASALCENLVSTDNNDQVLASWHGVDLLNCEFEVYLANVPEEDVSKFLLNKQRIGELGQQALLNKKLLSVANVEALEADEAFQKKLSLIKQNLLIDAYRKEYLEQQSLDNYEPQAREYYLTNQDRFTISEIRRVKHILIDYKQRSEAEALELATGLEHKIKNNAISFDEAIETHSDDTASKGSNAVLTVAPGKMVPEFEAAVNELNNIGDISEPVKTQFGYHIIKYESYEPERVADFEEYEDRLLSFVEEQHKQSVWERYIQSFSQSEQPVVNVDAMVLLLEKHASTIE